MLGIITLALICFFAIVYGWVFYNLPVLAVGARILRRNKQPRSQDVAQSARLPSFSVVLPVKDEEKVVCRLLQAVADLRYPSDKMEIVIVEDGSADDTYEICKQFAHEHGNVKVFRQPFSTGKPSALNYGLMHCTGEVVAFFDADNVPDADALLMSAKYFADPNVAAVQGRTMSINSRENMLTQFISYEETVWCEAYLRGKDALGLFVHLKGSCQFIRRKVLERLEGFDQAFLADDMEISARLTCNDYRIRYAGDVRAWQENPANLKTFLRQRTRWFRGTMEVAFKYGRLMAHPSRVSFDAEVTLLGPFILIASLLGYVAASGVFLADYPFDVVWRTLMSLSAIGTTLTLLLSGLCLVYKSKPKRMKNLLWLPFVFGYWFLQGFIALYAGLLIISRRPRRWVKTEKSGVMTSSEVESPKENIH